MYTLVCIVRTSDNMIIDNRNLIKKRRKRNRMCLFSLVIFLPRALPGWLSGERVS